MIKNRFALSRKHRIELESFLFALLTRSHLTVAPSLIALSLSLSLSLPPLLFSLFLFFCTYGLNSHRIAERSVYKGPYIDLNRIQIFLRLLEQEDTIKARPRRGGSYFHKQFSVDL